MTATWKGDAMQTTLLLLAAGMGSRYGGLKQMEHFGPEGQTLMDYSIADAERAGIKRAVFVIRKEFAEAFDEAVLKKWRGRIEVATCFQEMPQGRSKPWGTAHAVLAAKGLISGPFVMVNADDYYGPSAFRSLEEFFKTHGGNECAMAGYRLTETLSPHGGVTRAICGVDASGLLTSMAEWKGLERDPQGGVKAEGGHFSGDESVSMNCFGFQGDFMGLLEASFEKFLEENASSPEAECLIPDVVGQLVAAKLMSCKVIPGAGPWFGVTYPEDKDRVKAELSNLGVRS